MMKEYQRLYHKYKEFTMIPEDIFVGNLSLCEKFKNVEGCVAECGVWKGGMIAAVAEFLGNDRNYFLFDSFEGLPEAKEIDGSAAVAWQADKESPYYFDNCRADATFAERAMQMSGARSYRVIKGWFSASLPNFRFDEAIAILRLDSDWYASTMDCLDNLYGKVSKGGLIIIDDYYAWDGCSRAVHDFLSKNKIPARIRQSESGICYIIKV